MKILVITHYFPSHKGGVEIVAEAIISRLCHQGVKVTWLASDCDICPEDNSQLQCFSIPTLNLIEEKLGFAYPLWNLSIYRQLGQQIKQADVIHLHEYIYIGNIIAFLIAKKQKKPVIITQHIGFIPFRNSLFSSLLRLVNYTLGKWMLTKCDRTVFCSQVIADYWQGLKLKFKQPPLFIPNGVDTDIFYPVNSKEREIIREKLNLENNRLTILFVGRFVEKKGLSLLKQLAINYPQISWLFVGWGNLNPKQWQLGNVRVWENLQKSQLSPLYQCADLLILPSTGEAFPLVIQESMACGTPGFVSDESANQYPQLENLIFSAPVNTPDTAKLWNNQIREIINNQGNLTILREKVADFAHKYWSWENTAKSYEKLFLSLTRK